METPGKFDNGKMISCNYDNCFGRSNEDCYKHNLDMKKSGIFF